MASATDIRELLDDMPRWRQDVKVCDGTTTKYQFSDYPVVASSETVTVAGVTLGTNQYSINGTAAYVDLVTAGANEAELVVDYRCTQFHDDTIDNALTRNASVLELTMSDMCLRKAAGAGDFYSFVVGGGADQVNVDKKGVAKEWRENAKHWEARYADPSLLPVTDTTLEWEYGDQERGED